MSIRCRLNGIQLTTLPHITQNEEVYVVREEGEPWDSDNCPAYSIRLGSGHIGYIPLQTTIEEEAQRARDGFKKVWAEDFADMTPEELRTVAQAHKKDGKFVTLHDWAFVGTENTREIQKRKRDESDNLVRVRDFLDTETNINNIPNPRGTIFATYYDEKERRNYDEIGDICSLSVTFEDEQCSPNPLGTQTSASKLAWEAAQNDKEGE